ncbi:hypothetical protein [Lactobacillus mulieris]|uniref:Uncharacterized protein n=1 Tax=Lactobacillus mulieris TaxID=2508708 RepID=A0AAW5WWP5_9LACO|nr:hypothetical protein [Lactobacillus mulieris]MCZ3622128.1 hypothetical protein [Lactobacillus mulieris]MCZ3623825.1 hypothetical protein [Lactobacillus mulieris]MCZ3636135.1 hypothetical protein [Lactobacillus mulieris]MCZ3689934.1 hypothetical protein [Lactobacillus mulieris]MCZ3696579.1 hypothetical protein [Lactobacillus mulieris]
MPTKTKKYIRYSLIGVLALSFFAYWLLIAGMKPKYDIIFAVSFQHGLSIYLQSLLYVLVFFQVLVARKVSNAIAVRKQTKKVISKLAGLIVVEWLLFWIPFLGSYYLFKSHNFFKMGDFKFGLWILLAHMLLMLFLMLSLLLAYRLPFPYFIIILVIAITWSYHLCFEFTLILPKYSKLFDPLYRATHYIYLGICHIFL